MPILSIFGLSIILFCITIIFLNIEARLTVFAYAGIFIGIFLLYFHIFSLSILSAILLDGFVSAALLISRRIDFTKKIHYQNGYANLLFRFGIATAISILIFTIVPKVAMLLPIPNVIIYAAVSLFTAGIIFAAIEEDFFNSMIGILMIFSGFIMVYILLEPSILTIGILLGLNLMFAFVGSAFSQKESSHYAEKENSSL